jgi:polysaccharide export outer membrane protein
VGPYGEITLPRLGEFAIGGKTRREAKQSITGLYSTYYENPIITVKLLKFNNNKVYVLGRVSNPGMIHISGQATLLEALSIAGGLPPDGRSIFLSKCYIVRGKNQIIWIDLLNLLQNANTKLNIRLANNDIIYIPESINEAVFVMGEVRNPGSYPIQTTGFSILDAINLAGGPTENGKPSQVYIVRQLESGAGIQRMVDIEKMMTEGDFSENYLLQDNDIVYIPKKGIAKFNYYLRQIDPFMRTFISGMAIGQALDDDD